ncbi:ATP-binding cassette domain-containing protein [Oceanicoccus sp. KOV_DT_Chl]|uniref:ATP-binding cassette domain-containing protein n=1 Tax=Oceanicoccus sp. KOV_DT_Chl TaxID=1904639 RepID=UPI000C7E523D|nr:ATP-binding cassette domain-containing protein [Oceanicoccus sp. KOV_DT_Chl]
MIIHFQQVWAAYRTDPILRDINWKWQDDQQWAILGGNGAGKSAIAHLMTDQLRPQRGEILRQPTIDPEHDILHLSFELQQKLIEHDIRFDDSETRDDAFDVGTTVKQIVLQKQIETSRFTEIAKQCHIEHILDRGIRFVSTGESRKALLARALLNPPKVLILDNPFEGLDKQSQQELHNLIDTLLLSPIKVLLLIKQSDEIPDNISHVMHLQQGNIMALGERQTVLAAASQQQHQLVIADLPVAMERRYAVDKAQPLIALNHVNVSYKEQAILTDINWTLNWGQHCCIAGPNGAGKSTLLSLLSGDNHKAYGQDIQLFGNTRGSGESIWELKEKFGVVNTQLQLNHVGRTRVAEVIASGLYDSVGLYHQCSGKDRKIALDWLKVMGLEDIATQFFNRLSFGQQRLAMLARAMVKSPLVLVLDEPCIGLDEEHRQLILALIDKIADRGECHILYVSHSANEMPSCINQQLLLQPHPDGGFTAKVS